MLQQFMNLSLYSHRQVPPDCSHDGVFGLWLHPFFNTLIVTLFMPSLQSAVMQSTYYSLNGLGIATSFQFPHR